MQVHLTLQSSNSKTGKIPVSTTSKQSCPPTCPFSEGGCYALDYHLNMHWNKVTSGERGTGWEDFCTSISKFKPDTLWRHNQAGDLPGSNNIIDTVKLDQLVQANKGKNGFTYTHYPRTGQNAVAIKQANSNGFTINASTETLADADQAYNEGYPTTVVIQERVSPSSTFKTPSGNTVAICPAQLKDDVSCKTCALCQKVDRKVIVGFIAHGTSKAKVIKILAVKG
jgi:hypothetical protein